MNELALERFWWCLDQFVQNQVTWARDVQLEEKLGIEPPDLAEAILGRLAAAGSVFMYDPAAVAGEVWYAIREVDRRALGVGERSLFSLACDHFEVIAARHSLAVDVERGTSSWDGPADPDDPIFQALKQIAADRPPRPVEDTLAVLSSAAKSGDHPAALVLGKFGDRPVVLGREKSPLSKAQFDTVRALDEAGEVGLSKDNLERISKHSDAVGVLRRLRRDPDWAAVIRLPEISWKGYRIDRGAGPT